MKVVRVKVKAKKEDKVAPKKEEKISKILDAFVELWSALFTSPIHLDSALSKQSTRFKGILAQIVPSILLRPASLAEALGIGVAEGEPWNLEEPALVRWRSAALLAERLYEGMSQKWPDFQPNEADFPPWMLEEWKRSWTPQVVQDLIDVLGREAPLSIRACRRVGASELLKRLNRENLPIRMELSHFAPFGVRLAGYAPILNTDLYKEGAFEIQDEGSQWMALFALWPEKFGSILSKTPGRISQSGVNLKPDLAKTSNPTSMSNAPLTVIDACAGAGGKSLALADALKGKGRIYAYDTSEKKLQALRRRGTRMGLNNIQAVLVQQGSESELIDRFKSKADIVLVDAPCSGWGVIRRNPDIKWRQKRDVLERMPEIQLRLLSLYSGLVVPGGRLVYGVCTFRVSETVELVQRFLAAHPNFSKQEGGFLGPGPSDGFFMQSFIRKQNE